MTIKERLVEVYQSHGLDFVTSCEYATEWLRDLQRQPVGTEWTLGPSRNGLSVTVRKDLPNTAWGYVL